MANFQRYDHPDFKVLRNSEIFDADVGSATDAAIFRIRRKAIVRAAIIECVSVSSDATSNNFQIVITRAGSAKTIATLGSLTTMSVGSAPSTAPSTWVMTLNSSNTLASMGDYISFRHSEDDGQFNVHYEYQIVPGSGPIGNGPN
jgi:hypothetical protein